MGSCASAAPISLSRFGADEPSPEEVGSSRACEGVYDQGDEAFASQGGTLAHDDGSRWLSKRALSTLI
jgi:hypothetical protein